MTEATRWLFAMLALSSLVISLPATLSSGDSRMVLAALCGRAVLAASVCAGYLRRTAPLGMDLVDAGALLIVALSCHSPIAVLGFVFGALWFRSLYGSTRRAVLRCVLYAGAIAASLPSWPQVPGHVEGTAVAPLLGVIPTMFVTVIVGRHLAGNLRAREQATRLDAVHAALGARLLGATDAHGSGALPGSPPPGSARPCPGCAC